jgi:hypothetical protein
MSATGSLSVSLKDIKSCLQMTTNTKDPIDKRPQSAGGSTSGASNGVRLRDVLNISAETTHIDPPEGPFQVDRAQTEAFLREQYVGLAGIKVSDSGR